MKRGWSSAWVGALALSGAAGLAAGCGSTGVPRTPSPYRPTFRIDASANPSAGLTSAGVSTDPGAAQPMPGDKVVEPTVDVLDASKPGASALSLESIVNRALDANRGLLSARDGVASAGYSLASARAPFLLRIFPAATANVDTEFDDAYGLGVDIQKRFETGTFVSVAPGVQRTGDAFTSEIATTLRQPLLRGTDREFVRTGIDGAEFSARTARRSLFLAQVDTVLTTLATSYQVVRQRELLRLNEDSTQRLEGHAEAARARERAGISSSLDVYRATLQFNRAQDNLDSAREGYGDALDNLRIQLALDLGVPLDVDAPLTYAWVELQEAEAIEIALANRVELLQAADALDDARRRSRVARHGTEPDVDLQLSWSRFETNDEFDRSLELEDSALSLSVVTSSDLLRRREFAAFGQSLLDVKAAQRNLEFQRDQVVRQVRRELRDLLRAKRRTLLQEDQIAQSLGKLELARVKFQRGLAGNFDVVEAEGELRSAQTSLVGAVIDYIVGTYRLRAALGTLLELPAEGLSG